MGEMATFNGISVLVPFDIGESYIFKVPGNLCEDCIWKNIFGIGSEPNCPWTTGRLGEASSFYAEPFGPIARYKPANSLQELTEKLQDDGNVFAGFVSLEIIFFTRGVGVLFLKAKMDSRIRANWRRDFMKSRESLRAILTPVAANAQAAYRQKMKDAMESKRFKGYILPIGLRGRREEIKDLRFPYAIAFGVGKPVLREPDDKTLAATLSDPHPLRYYYRKLTEGAENDVTLSVDVGWGESTVYSDNPIEWSSERRAIEEGFIVAMASWFTLVLMSNLVSRFLQNSFVDLAKNQHNLSDKDGQKIRLAFLDASNASRPVRWTFRERDILLLDRIHSTWSTERWWKSIEERTTLLTERHNEVATERRRDSERKLAVLVVALAALTALSAIRDVAETISDLCEHLVKNGLVILFMLLALAAAFGSYRWARSKEIGPEKD